MFPFLFLSFHAFTCLYTYMCNGNHSTLLSLAIDIVDSTGTVIFDLTMSDLG